MMKKKSSKLDKPALLIFLILAILVNVPDVFAQDSSLRPYKEKQILVLIGPHYGLPMLEALDDLPKNLHIETTADLPYEKMLERVATLPRDAIAFYGSYFHDITGHSFVPAEVAFRVNDMNNLLAGTGIATVFVDHRLRILRFTPFATKIINLIQSDIGRPVAHIVSNLPGYGSLKEDTQAVLDTLVPREADVQTAEGRWYTMRIQPYRTMDNVIEGAVRMYDWSEAVALAMSVRDRIPESLRKDELARLIELGQAKILEPYSTQRISKQGSVVQVSIVSTALLDATGKIHAIATTERVEGTANERESGKDIGVYSRLKQTLQEIRDDHQKYGTQRRRRTPPTGRGASPEHGADLPVRANP